MLCRLHTLPSYVLQHILAQLCHRDLAAAGSTCRHLQQQAKLTVPGLLLHLYPHQVRCMSATHRRQMYAIPALPTGVVRPFSTWATTYAQTTQSLDVLLQSALQLVFAKTCCTTVKSAVAQ